MKQYNVISIGDHCAIPMLLKELNIRNCSYPFDWISNANELYETNIMHNVELITELTSNKQNCEIIVNKFLGDALHKENKINSKTNIWFPHESGTEQEIIQKYIRRFNRLHNDLYKPTVFIILTRHYYISEDIFQNITNQLLKYNTDSVIYFISGCDHNYFNNTNLKNPRVIFKHIPYDISQFYNYDYTNFRPAIKKYLQEIFYITSNQTLDYHE